MLKEKTSLYGDVNPLYVGSVVKALSSAKKEVPALLKTLTHTPKGVDHAALKEKLTARIESIDVLAPNIYEIKVYAPLCAQNFKPGQFFKLQNYETYSNAFEPLALTGAYVEGDIVSLIVLITGQSSKMLTQLFVGEPVVLMGPTGEPTQIPSHKNILLLGGGLGNAVLFSIGQAAMQRQNHVTYMAAYRTKESRFKRAEIEKSADRVIWVCEEGLLEKARPQDDAFFGNMIEALAHYQHLLNTFDFIMAIGSDGMMRAVAKARFVTMADAFKPSSILMGSINAPMQCMMKGICGQCVQVHKDPVTKEESVFFACSEQDQNLKTFDFNCLKERLSQNSLQEKIAKSLILSV
ncbi:MAG: Dihydroorotate dehydrogenase B (NAD(+)), electron transfer subunit [Holosporales bacterium]